MAREDRGFWRGFVWGILTPMAVGLVVTVVGTIVALAGGRREIGPGDG